MLKLESVFLSRILQGYFSIGSADGRISSTTSSIDYEEFSYFNITVHASDNGTPERSVTQTVTIRVIDVNHPPTEIQFSGKNVSQFFTLFFFQSKFKLFTNKQHIYSS